MNNVTPIRSDEPPSIPVTKLIELVTELQKARAAVFVCAQALDTGDDRTDLEQHSARLLKRVFDELNMVEDELSDLRPGLLADAEDG
jgi:hypothetical protein